MANITLLSVQELYVGAPYVIVDAADMMSIHDDLPLEPDCAWRAPEIQAECNEILFFVGVTDVSNEVRLLHAWTFTFGELKKFIFISSRTGQEFIVFSQERAMLPLKRICE